MASAQSLVSAEWLKTHLAAPDIRVIDATWHMAASGRDAKAEYEEAHIPGAVFFDIDEMSDERSALPNMAPPVEKFMARIRRMGVGDGHRIIVYDTVGLFSAARVWWLFKYFGHPEVAVLDGGLPAWRAVGGEIEDRPPLAKDRHFTPKIQSMLFKDVTEVSATLKFGTAQILDARAPERFRGEVPEPREGLRSGHMPGAINVPFQSLLNSDGSMLSVAALTDRLSDAGVNLSEPIVTSCGSGITAAIINLALDQIGHSNNSLYDGSWTEWGSGSMLPVVTGAD